MDIFISWSGAKSKAVAEALCDKLPKILNAFRPWLSSSDLGAGARWIEEVGEKLEAAKAGIVCLTAANLHEDWILFETGALAKTVSETFVCPVLIGLEPSQVKFPLSQFQSVPLNRDGIWRLVKTLRTALPPEQVMTDKQVEQVFDLVWPGLEKAISNLPSDDETAPAPRKPEEIMTEILELVRGLSRSRPVPTIQTWETGITGTALDIASSLGLQPRSVSTAGMRHGEYLIDIQTQHGKTYRVAVPADTAIIGFEEIIRADLMNQIRSDAQVGLKEMVADGSDFLNR